MEEYLKLLPENVVNKIFVFNSHPVADLFKKSRAYLKYRNNDHFKEDDDSFNKFYFNYWILYHGCDKCMKPWRECQCFCYNGHDRSLCHGNCYEHRWCMSCLKYSIPKTCKSCPRC